MMVRLEICVICEKTMRIDDDNPHWWGHNAEPVKEGVCCDDCWLYEVLKVRLIEAGAPQNLLDTLKREEDE